MRWGVDFRWLAVCCVLGCAADGGEQSGDADASASADSGGTTTATSGNATEPGNQDSGGTTMPGAGTGCNFLCVPDAGGVNECDVWLQDCPAGNKCMPWANDGGNSWNATRCSPVDDAPTLPGDTCTAEGSGVSGVDNCVLGAMCWDIDPETNEGLCVGFCEGSAQNAFCPDPDTGCSISNDGVLILCLPFCDPLLQDCADGNACYAEENGFFCSPDASGPDQGVYGDPCEFLNACDPGLFCAAPTSVPGCASSAGCCSEFCDHTEMVTCMGPGQECLPFHEPGQSPPGEQDYGVCVIPEN